MTTDNTFDFISNFTLLKKIIFRKKTLNFMIQASKKGFSSEFTCFQ
ncbi:hypothetical protein RV04_GL000165 [Enterococcus hermanniensis]|uniref:Uncharacterized protein n=1 Tax=Enterococcus hermanniensis TaxID=249189 RepID=A0A1L8TRV9_9ENTE|nr:hypothetical protein RV04_GL000165 [Enterococcus hermanniensis]